MSELKTRIDALDKLDDMSLHLRGVSDILAILAEPGDDKEGTFTLLSDTTYRHVEEITEIVAFLTMSSDVAVAENIDSE